MDLVQVTIRGIATTASLLESDGCMQAAAAAAEAVLGDLENPILVVPMARVPGVGQPGIPRSPEHNTSPLHVPGAVSSLIQADMQA